MNANDEMNYIKTTTHDFKTHFSEYVRLLQENPDSALIIYKYKKPLGFFMPISKELEKELETAKP